MKREITNVTQKVKGIGLANRKQPQTFFRGWHREQSHVGGRELGKLLSYRGMRAIRTHAWDSLLYM